MEGSPLLLCDEELMLSSPSHNSSPLSLGCLNYCCSSTVPAGGDITISEEDLKIVFQEFMTREHVYQPYVQYVEQLQASTELSSARFRAVRWIILACSRLKLSLGTTFNAVNYLDRFISMNCSLEWETWMMELLSIACISIASKLDEVIIPSLHDFLEEVEHTFKPSTIQRMELSVLKALNWRLNSVTSYSYVDLLIMRRPRANRVTELLLHALLDSRFLEFKPCDVAASALQCGLGASENHLMLSFPKERRDHINECSKIMQEYSSASSWMKNNHGCPQSPVTVILMQSINVDINGFFKSFIKP